MKSILEVDEDIEEELGHFDPESPELSPFVPTSPGELFLALVLATPSLLFTAYLCVTLYRCICKSLFYMRNDPTNFKKYKTWRVIIVCIQNIKYHFTIFSRSKELCRMEGILESRWCDKHC